MYDDDRYTITDLMLSTDKCHLDPFWSLFIQKGDWVYRYENWVSDKYFACRNWCNIYVEPFFNWCSYQSLLSWLPVIFFDRQWDHAYLTKIIHHKIGLMRDCFRDYGCHVDIEKEIKEMDICLTHLKRIMDDDYIFMYDNIIGMDAETKYKLQDEVERRDRTIAFNVIKNRLRHWWD